MRLLDKIQGVLQRGLDNLRGPVTLPVPSPQPAPSTPVAVAAQARKSKIAIEASDLKAGQNWRANEWFTLAYYETPRRVRLELPAGATYLFGVKAKKAQAAAGAGAQNITLDGLVQSYFNGPVPPTTYHPDVLVFAVVGGLYQPCEINSINYATGVVNFDEPAGATSVVAYYLSGVGQWRMSVKRATGNLDQVASGILNGSFSWVHGVDQRDAVTAPRMSSTVVLTPDDRLQLEVYSSQEYEWADRAQHVLVLDGFLQDLEVVDQRALNALGEAVNRAGA
jgi:hypothetical protein